MTLNGSRSFNFSYISATWDIKKEPLLIFLLWRCAKVSPLRLKAGLLQKKVKNTALDFTVPTGGADLCFLALQPVSAMGRQPSFAFAHLSCLPSPDFSRYSFRAGSTLAELTESHHWPPSQTKWLGTLGFESLPSQTKDSESSASIHSARTRPSIKTTLL